ncbi:hypothetical protein PLEOSDRAFT_1108480 [Pleurotus ostreatus PC15]|uniref:Uncharacterized protein n=1 Tax=Pleurotus ostreatus (strain PC15) TaxID=1137138 RepID=A0A067N7L0_PLEO1|nr:hypothetical protein PLEOSDRAFT_1108480 [Pleurotus ostreatus PC15]
MSDPEVTASNGESFGRVFYALFGLYIWEWAMFLDADWRYVKNIRRSPLSPMLLSFLNRYCLLAVLISVLISLHLNATSGVNCRSLYLSVNASDHPNLNVSISADLHFNLKVFGDIALELANIGFTVRIASLWRHSRLAPHLIAFFITCLGTQGWLLWGAYIDSAWPPDSAPGCSITRADNTFSNIGHIFNAGYSLVLLAFVTWDYARPSGRHDVLRPRPRQSTASLKDLCWFGVAFLASCTNAVFVWVHPNPGMATVAALLSTTAISIASSRVLRLRECAAQAPALPVTTTTTTTQHISTDAHSPSMRPRLGFRGRWKLVLGRPRAHDVPAGSSFQRLYSAPASQTGSYLHASASASASASMQAANSNSTRPSSIILPSLIAPSSTYSPNRASYDPSTHLDSASESSARGDRYDLDAQLGATQRRSL